VIFKKFNRGTAFATGLALTLSSLGLAIVPGFSATVANAATLSYLSQLQQTKVVGLVIQYRDGVSPLAPNGQMTAANFAGIALKPGHGIGLNMFTASFAGKPTQLEIAAAMASLARSPKVAMVAPDQKISLVGAALPVSTRALVARANGAVTVAKLPVRAATEARSLKVADAWSAAKPAVAQLLLTWAAPTALFGGKLTGYQIGISTDGGKTFRVLVENTKSLTRKYLVSTNLTAGATYSFKVRAVSKFGTTTKLGIVSKVAAGMPTGLPQAPVLLGSDIVSNSTSPTWLPQNLTQRGGLAVTYTATASSSGAADVTCSPPDANTFSCQFVGLDSLRQYTAKVTATNARGSATSLPSQVVTDPMFAEQWYLTGKYGINVENAWSLNKGAYSTGNTTKRVTVAVIDTGYTEHPDLNSQYVRNNGQVYGYDFVSDPNSSNDGNGWDSNPADPGDYSINADSSWHGTHISGLIAAQANNGEGITGVAPEAQILPIRALGARGGNSSDLAAAINWAIGVPIPLSLQDPFVVTSPQTNLYPAQVINISMGTSSFTICDKPTQTAVTAAVNRNVTIVTAAGNEMMRAGSSYPGNCLGTINVGATSAVGDRAYYSNFGGSVDVSAPGGDNTQSAGTSVDADGQILSTVNSGTQGPIAPDYAYEEGTSMAAPLVAGVVAMMYAAHPSITFTQAATIVINTATPFNNDPNLTYNAGATKNQILNALGHCSTQVVGADKIRPDGWCGSGIVNAAAAVAAAAALP